MADDRQQVPKSRTLKTYTPPQTSPRLIHEDEDVLVLSKPSGLLSVPGRGTHLADCLESRVRETYPEALTVHRLDMDTSGLVVMARGKEAQRHLGLQFEQRKVKKTYIAQIWGAPAEDEGFVDLPLIVDWPNRPLQKVCHETGKPAQTHWRILERGAATSLIELKPVTGRSHQLRVHMKELGCPILGDEFYAHEKAFAAAERLMLHAQNLGFHHPESGDWAAFEDLAAF